MARTAAATAVTKPEGRWRSLAALLAALLTYLPASAGLLFYLPLPQLALLTGVAGGLLAPDPAFAALAAGAGVAIGMLLRAPSALAPAWGSPGALGPAAATVAGAAAVAYAARFALTRWRGRAGLLLTIGAVALIVANLWASVAVADRAPAFGGRSLETILTEAPASGVPLSDDEFYHSVLVRLRAGEPYYAAFHDAYAANPRWGGPPDSVLSYRLPTLFYFLAAVPGGADGIVVALLLLVSGAVAAVVWLTAQRVRLPLAIPAAASLAAYFLYPLTRPSILYIEPWAATVSVIALACLVAADSGGEPARGRRLLVAGVALVVLAALLRELMVFLLVAGIAGAAFAPRAERRFRLGLWSGGTALVVVAYAAHAAAASAAGIAGRLGVSPWLSGGPLFAYYGLLWNNRYLGADAWFPIVLALAGLTGALLAPDRSRKALLTAACVLPLGAFLFFGNGATTGSGIPVNYWGAIVMPLLIALSPWAFAAIPGMARRG
jgi:hypothetical protein